MYKQCVEICAQPHVWAKNIQYINPTECTEPFVYMVYAQNHVHRQLIYKAPEFWLNIFLCFHKFNNSALILDSPLLSSSKHFTSLMESLCGVPVNTHIIDRGEVLLDMFPYGLIQLDRLNGGADYYRTQDYQRNISLEWDDIFLSFYWLFYL